MQVQTIFFTDVPFFFSGSGCISGKLSLTGCVQRPLTCARQKAARPASGGLIEVQKMKQDMSDLGPLYISKIAPFQSGEQAFLLAEDRK